MNNLMQALYDTALSAELPIISTDTAAKIMAVTYVHGNNEFMCCSDKFKTEVDYIQKRFGIQGSSTPNAEIVKAIQHYVADLEQYEKENPKERYSQWAVELFQNRYGFKLIN